MTNNNHATNREIQQEARAWSAFSGTKYTAALRQMRSPLAQGLLGDRVGARLLIAALRDRELIGSHGDEPLLGETGYGAGTRWQFNGETDFIRLALITDVLRMFTPVSEASQGVNSYSLKHTLEWFLGPHSPYVSNGRVIWAAAALGLPIAVEDGDGPNAVIGVSEREHDYVRRMVQPGQARPNADHYRPAGFEHLQSLLAQAAAGEPIVRGWAQPVIADDPAPFHDWLMRQAGRDDVVGDLARDYAEGVRDSEHRIAHTADELLVVFNEVSHSEDAYDAVVVAIAEWTRTSPLAKPIRTELVGRDENVHGGWGAGEGTTERYEYLCPCGDGRIIEEHDNIPGFRDHDVRIDCDKCRDEWRFVDTRSTRNWGLEPVVDSLTV